MTLYYYYLLFIYLIYFTCAGNKPPARLSKYVRQLYPDLPEHVPDKMVQLLMLMMEHEFLPLNFGNPDFWAKFAAICSPSVDYAPVATQEAPVVNHPVVMPQVVMPQIVMAQIAMPQTVAAKIIVPHVVQPISVVKQEVVSRA